jgi:hypothetical protein
MCVAPPIPSTEHLVYAFEDDGPPPLVEVNEVTWNVITEAPQWYQDWLNAQVEIWTKGG